MSLLELKRGIETSSDEDRLYLLALLKHLTRRNSDEYKRHLAARAREIEAGNQISLDQIKRLHKALEADGL